MIGGKRPYDLTFKRSQATCTVLETDEGNPHKLPKVSARPSVWGEYHYSPENRGDVRHGCNYASSPVKSHRP